MEAIERRGLLKKMRWAPAPLQIALCGVFLTFATPMCCALYPQISPIAIDKLEPELQVIPCYIIKRAKNNYCTVTTQFIIIEHIHDRPCTRSL